MNCPVCGERLREIERSGVMIDICPSCKGIWLDRGEIDKLIAAEGAQGRPAARTERDDDHHEHDGQRGQGEPGKGKRRTSFFEDILGGFGGD